MNEPKQRYVIPAIMRQKLEQADKELMPAAAHACGLVDELDKFHSLVDQTREILQDAMGLVNGIKSDFQAIHDGLFAEVRKLPASPEKIALYEKLEHMLERLEQL